jgi:hypothetical protein
MAGIVSILGLSARSAKAAKVSKPVWLIEIHRMATGSAPIAACLQVWLLASRSMAVSVPMAGAESGRRRGSA